MSPRPSLSSLGLSSSHLSTSAHKSIFCPSSSCSLSSPQHPQHPRRPIDRALLVRLHALSALTPPPTDSPDESNLIQGLSELLTFMDAVQTVQLPITTDSTSTVITNDDKSKEMTAKRTREQVIRDLLSGGANGVTGTGSKSGFLIDGSHNVDNGIDEQNGGRGRDLLKYATNRVGDYYGFKTKRP